MANSTATAIEGTATEKQLGTDATLGKLTVTRENVELACTAAAKAGLRITGDVISIQFDQPKSNKLRFYIAEWKDEHRAELNPDKKFYKELSEQQAKTIATLSDRIHELEDLIEEMTLSLATEG